MEKQKQPKVSPPSAAERSETERSDGERSGAADGGAQPALFRRWTASRKVQVVIRLLRGESLEAVSRDVKVPPWKLAKWRDRAVAGMEVGLSDRPRELGEVMQEQAESLIAKLAIENDLLKKKTAGKPWRLKP